MIGRERMPAHHPPADALAAYTSGSADEAEALLAATHLALCPVCRGIVDGMEAVGGVLLDREADAPMGDGALEQVLRRLDSSERQEPAPPSVPAGRDDAPLPLRALTGPLDSVPFRQVAPGIRRFDLPLTRPGRPVALVSLRPGIVVPPHRHSSTERGLVLRGGFTDETGHFVRGDVSWRDTGEPEPHRQRIDQGDRCVVLMVDDGPKVPITWGGKIINALFGI
jgi:putative transcriptional regulator